MTPECDAAVTALTTAADQVIAAASLIAFVLGVVVGELHCRRATRATRATRTPHTERTDDL